MVRFDRDYAAAAAVVIVTFISCTVPYMVVEFVRMVQRLDNAGTWASWFAFWVASFRWPHLLGALAWAFLMIAAGYAVGLLLEIRRRV